MILIHHDLQIELLDEWWVAAGMKDFRLSGTAYRVDISANPNQTVYEVRIEDVVPVHRAQGVGIFNNDMETGLTAQERTVSILQGFRSNAAFKPVEVKRLPSTETHKYKLLDGTHRFYCSLAAGFTCVPAVVGFDWKTL